MAALGTIMKLKAFVFEVITAVDGAGNVDKVCMAYNESVHIM